MPVLNEREYEITSLYDLTDEPEHKNIPLNDLWIDALTETFPEVDEQTSQQSISSYRMTLSGDNAKIVIRCTPLVWDLIRAVAIVAVFSNLIEEDWAKAILTVAALSDVMPQIKESFVGLDEGEQCVYLALFKSVGLAARLKRQYPTRAQLIETCQEVCPEQASGQDLETVIDRLLEKGVFKKPSENTLWVIF